MPARHSRRAYSGLERQAEVASTAFFSYLVPSIGRSSLNAAVRSILTQNFSPADFEIVVVNDSGSQLPRADWHASPRVRIIHTNRCERSVARNSGAAVAKGEYLAFLDDDDWLLPGALEAFWRLANRCPKAVWLYGGIHIVDQQGTVLAEMNSALAGNCFAQIMGGAWAPLQASVVQAHAFFEVGGFDPRICGTEDEDLCRRMAYHGEFASTPQVVACLYRGPMWSTTTNYLRAPEDTKYSRDLILSKPGAFRRLRVSAGSSYWKGRVLHVYLSALKWNLKRRRIFTALSRLFGCLAAFGLSANHLFSREYWAGLRADHVPETLHFVMKNHEQGDRQQESFP